MVLTLFEVYELAKIGIDKVKEDEEKNIISWIGHLPAKVDVFVLLKQVQDKLHQDAEKKVQPDWIYDAIASSGFTRVIEETK